jgi:50S ribosomal subunit-associated GTPase HflX
MREALVLGKPNVGKTLFILNFAGFLGQTALALEYIDSTGTVWRRAWTLSEARAALVSSRPHHTLRLQRFHVEVPVRKGKRTLTLMDTAGIAEGIPDEATIRAAMAQTLAQLGSGQLVLHVVDASAPFGSLQGVGPVDEEIAAILANKLDVPGAKEGLQRIRRRFAAVPAAHRVAGFPIIPCSARTLAGFAEVKAFVFRHWLR